MKTFFSRDFCRFGPVNFSRNENFALTPNKKPSSIQNVQPTPTPPTGWLPHPWGQPEVWCSNPQPWRHRTPTFDRLARSPALWESRSQEETLWWHPPHGDGALQDVSRTLHLPHHAPIPRHWCWSWRSQHSGQRCGASHSLPPRPTDSTAHEPSGRGSGRRRYGSTRRSSERHESILTRHRA